MYTDIKQSHLGISSEHTQKIPQIKNWALQMSKLFLSKARGLTSFLSRHDPIEIDVEELMYSHAIKLAKEAAYDEMVHIHTAYTTIIFMYVPDAVYIPLSVRLEYGQVGSHIVAKTKYKKVGAP